MTYQRFALTRRQMTLGQLTERLEALVTGAIGESQAVYFDFCGLYPDQLMSWRGSYEELAFDYGAAWTEDRHPRTVDHWAKRLRQAHGEKFVGYKGGGFVMHKDTPLWVAKYGSTSETAVVDVVPSDYGIYLITERCTF